jgi:hypothetical protein
MKPLFLVASLFPVCLFTTLTAAEQSVHPEAAPPPRGAHNIGPHGEKWTNNLAEMWPGVWKESTNGLRVQIYYVRDPRSGEQWVDISVGSAVVNSYGDYAAPPGGEFARFELTDSGGSEVPPVPGAKLEARLPERIPAKSLPRWHDGALKLLHFNTQTAGARLRAFRISDIYHPKASGYFTLTVCPVIYKFGANRAYLDRLDLPCVSTNFYLSAAE